MGGLIWLDRGVISIVFLINDAQILIGLRVYCLRQNTLAGGYGLYSLLNDEFTLC